MRINLLKMKFIKIIIYAIVTTIFLIVFGDFILKIFLNSGTLYNGDFYINYQGGFARRGLDGEIIYQISKYLRKPPWILFKVYSFAFFLIFCVLIFYYVKKFNIPLLFLLSMSCIPLYLIYALPLRKDHIILSLLMILILILKNINHKLKTIFIVNVFFIVATLIHEIFFLVSFFPVVYILVSKSNIKNFPVINIFYYFFLPSVVFFFSAFIYNGNINQKEIIINSWENLGLSNVSFNKGIFEQSLFIWKYNVSIWQYVYLFTILLINFLFAFFSIIQNKYNKQKSTEFIILLTLQYLVAILLCIVATDYARWIFIANFTSIIFFCKVNKLQSVTNNLLREKKNILIFYFLYFFATSPFTTVAAQNINGYINALPINILKNYIIK